MNRRMVFYILGRIIMFEAILLLLPSIVAVIYRESALWSFLIAAGVALAVSFALTFLSRPSNRLIYAKEGFVIVALAWIIMSAIGALPFTLSGQIPSYIDALFETVSGFTTTGASILTDVESMCKSCLFWRSFTHWVGGMGVLVFIMAVVPSLCDRSIHILRAEVPGPVVGKLVPRVRQTAKILYLIYIGLTLTELILLLFGGMNFFEATVHALGTAGTGGFGIKADSISSYSPYIQWVIAIFMIVFGVNFNLYYFILIRRGKTAIKSSELWCYICMILISAGIICYNIMPIYQNVGDSARHSVFQVATVMSTSGFATADFNAWPMLSKTILLILMFAGGCAGSTAGGLKISRIMILFKMIKRELLHMVHPRSVASVKLEGKKVDEVTAKSVGIYFALYIILILSAFFLLSFETGFDTEANFTAAVSCFNNIGPGLGAVGPMGGYAGYSAFSKIVLTLAMLFGRLEIYPILFTIIPSTWSRKIN